MGAVPYLASRRRRRRLHSVHITPLEKQLIRSAPSLHHALGNVVQRGHLLGVAKVAALEYSSHILLAQLLGRVVARANTCPLCYTNLFQTHVARWVRDGAVLQLHVVPHFDRSPSLLDRDESHLLLCVAAVPVPLLLSHPLPLRHAVHELVLWPVAVLRRASLGCRRVTCRRFDQVLEHHAP